MHFGMGQVKHAFMGFADKDFLAGEGHNDRWGRIGGGTNPKVLFKGNLVNCFQQGRKIFVGYEEWESLVGEDKPWFDFLCANHARNLPMDELNRRFQTYITKELGESMKAIQLESGGRSRVEASGILFLRSLCRLTHTGHAQYAKGDGVAFRDFLQRWYPNLKNRCVRRAEKSKRKDWSCEASWNLYNLMGPILEYTIETLQGGADILRDSVLTRIQDQHFKAYVHANAIL
jgi:hypothetical protein